MNEAKREILSRQHPLSRPQPLTKGGAQSVQGSVERLKVGTLWWVGTHILQHLDHVIGCWRFRRQMSTLRLESILIGNVHDLVPLAVRCREGEVSVGVRSIVTCLGCTDTVACLVVVRVRSVRIDHGVLVEGFGAGLITTTTSTGLRPLRESHDQRD
uniref:Uncharacterized protein n=1 Tax=Anopheles maculatus TaxID=74869 RepID=A0A182SGJ1_9DIPT